MALGAPATWPWAVIRSRVLWFGVCTLPPVARELLPEVTAIDRDHGLQVRPLRESIEVTL